MKRLLLMLALILSVTLTATARRTGKMLIFGTECTYDTVSYRSIGPGATLLQIRFDNIRNGYYTYNLLAHIIEIDMTNQYNKFSTKLSNKGFYKWTNILTELKTEKKAGKKPIAAVTGMAYTESGNVSPTTKDAEVSGSMIGDGVIYYYNKSEANSYYYNYMDRLAHVAKTHMYGRISANGETWPIAQINRFRDRNGKNSDITLFCNGIAESQVSDANKASGTDVVVKLLNTKKQIIAGEEIECEVISVLSGGGHKFNDDEAILSGDGSATDKLNSLKAGQRIKITVDILDAKNNTLNVDQLAPQFNGNAIQDGVALGNSSVYTAQILGVSKDNTKTYIATMDDKGSSCSCACFAEVLKNLGVYNGLFLDGGPSADIAVDEEVISHNLESDRGGRHVGSCYVLYSTAPNDDNIAKLETDDNSTRIVQKGSEITLNVWGYNKYGEMVRQNVVDTYDITVTCTNDIGTVLGNKFTATNEGVGEIIYTTNSGYKLSIPVTVLSDAQLHIHPEKIYTGEGRPCQASLYIEHDGNVIQIDPASATWSTENYIIESVTNGCIMPSLFDGMQNATITAEYLGLKASATVTIDNLDEVVDKIDLNGEVKTNTQIGFQLKSVPTSFTVKVQASANQAVTLRYSTGFENHSVTKTADANGIIVFTVTLDYFNIMTYPVTVKDISSSSTAKIIDFYANYGETTDVSSVITTDKDNTINYNAPIYTLSGQRIDLNRNYHGIVIQNGKKVVIK